ncbi:protein Wnt-6 [Condylostylus longicornis]|uniref:protein Wnt-6 n=1 Tax=Condylostylus longicornis TaxID=2530218 RepID=UPI00244DC11F|nr:protein Wnt-6 [Condylostylus longicornis]
MNWFIVLGFFAFVLMPLTGNGRAAGNNLLLDPDAVCNKPHRVRGKIAEICKHKTTLLKEIKKGISLGFGECEIQFKYNRWNCSTLLRSMRKILMKETKEAAFVNAITSAGITYAVTKACTTGALVECSCDKNHLRRNKYIITEPFDERKNSIEEYKYENQSTKRIRRRKVNNREKLNQNRKQRREEKLLKSLKLPDGDWEWGGCGDNVQFGFRKSRDFLDSRYRRRSDITTLVRLHNNNAGRMAVRDNMRLDCKCHGLSGSCTMKTCWLKMPSFHEIGTILKERYNNALKVSSHNDGDKFMLEKPIIGQKNRITKYDIIYTDISPDFCDSNYKTGSLGTYKRECNLTSSGNDNCDTLCCNRGYIYRTNNENINCNCVFKWCCDVKCDICQHNRTVTICR